MKFRFSRSYASLAVLIFIFEVLIALYVHDDFIRPYVGDFLVVILIYCFVRAFIKSPVWPMAIGVLIFSYLVETLQYFHFVKLIGLAHSRAANIILGNSFSWTDMLCYTLGIALVVLVEKIRR
jgi:hypothetical protein